MPPDYVLQEYQPVAVGMIYAMLANPYQPVSIENGQVLPLWQVEAAKLHCLRLQIEALRQMGVL